MPRPAATRNDAASIRILLLTRFDPDKATVFVVVNSSRHDDSYSVVNVHEEKMLKDIQMLFGNVVQITQTPGKRSRVQDID